MILSYRSHEDLSCNAQVQKKSSTHWQRKSDYFQPLPELQILLIGNTKHFLKPENICERYKKIRRPTGREDLIIRPQTDLQILLFRNPKHFVKPKKKKLHVEVCTS